MGQASCNAQFCTAEQEITGLEVRPWSQQVSARTNGQDQSKSQVGATLNDSASLANSYFKSSNDTKLLNTSVKSQNNGHHTQ